jgi:2-amino-4-hydroxy-6-hydroxymethyldihydropteridine diphosphokinase
MQNARTTAYIALGANLGDREANILAALAALGSTPGTPIIRVSRLIENPAIGGPANSPNFLNAVAEIQTALSPLPLLHRLLEIERSLGRQRREKWEPRLIDLDLLLYSDQIISTDELIVPHPLMHTRRFVLEPLVELSPTLIHPILRVTVADLLKALPS